MLLAAEPTSAVDAHTEAAIAERLTAARAGRGTLLATTSPVLLDRADVVHYLVDGRVAASGTHRELLAARARIPRPGAARTLHRGRGGAMSAVTLPIADTAAGGPGGRPADRRRQPGRRRRCSRSTCWPRWPAWARRTCWAGSSTRSPGRGPPTPGSTCWPAAVLPVRAGPDGARPVGPAARLPVRRAHRGPHPDRLPGPRAEPCPPRWSSGCRRATWPPAARPTWTRSPARCATCCPASSWPACRRCSWSARCSCSTRCSGVAGLLGLSGIWFTGRWYLRRARNAYLEEGAANSELAEELAATTAGRAHHRGLRPAPDAGWPWAGPRSRGPGAAGWPPCGCGRCSSRWRRARTTSRSCSCCWSAACSTSTAGSRWARSPRPCCTCGS